MVNIWQDNTKTVPKGTDSQIVRVPMDQLDIAGSAHLFKGEAALLQDLQARMLSSRISGKAAVADTPACAWAAARFSKETIVAPGRADLCMSCSRAIPLLVHPYPLCTPCLRNARGIVGRLNRWRWWSLG